MKQFEIILENSLYYKAKIKADSEAEAIQKALDYFFDIMRSNNPIEDQLRVYRIEESQDDTN